MSKVGQTEWTNTARSIPNQNAIERAALVTNTAFEDQPPAVPSPPKFVAMGSGSRGYTSRLKFPGRKNH